MRWISFKNPLILSDLRKRFKKAIDKIKQITFNNDGTFFVKDGFKKINVNLNEVSFIEANGGYLKINNAKTKETTLTLCSLNEFEKQLKPYYFFRIQNFYEKLLVKKIKLAYEYCIF
jgi:DNA-binding LytR/AlgR family response regulator